MPEPGDDVDTSEWDCPCDIADLEEWVTNDKCECDVCETEQPAGHTFYGNREEDWDVCEACFVGTSNEPEEEEQVSEAEMAMRLHKLNMMEVQRQKEQGIMPHQIHKMQQAMKQQMPNSQIVFSPGMRVRSNFMALGKQSDDVVFGTVETCNDDDTITVKFDFGQSQSIPSQWAYKMSKAEEPHWKIVLGIPLEEHEIPHSSLMDETRGPRALGSNKRYNPPVPVANRVPKCWQAERDDQLTDAPDTGYTGVGTRKTTGIHRIHGVVEENYRGKRAQDRRDKWLIYNRVKKKAQSKGRGRNEGKYVTGANTRGLTADEVRYGVG